MARIRPHHRPVPQLTREGKALRSIAGVSWSKVYVGRSDGSSARLGGVLTEVDTQILDAHVLIRNLQSLRNRVEGTKTKGRAI